MVLVLLSPLFAFWYVFISSLSGIVRLILNMPILASLIPFNPSIVDLELSV